MLTYREVMCPVCEKKYMTYKYKEDGFEYRVKKHNEWVNGWADTCPKCDIKLFVEDGKLDGIVFDYIPEDDVIDVQRRIIIR